MVGFPILYGNNRKYSLLLLTFQVINQSSVIDLHLTPQGHTWSIINMLLYGMPMVKFPTGDQYKL